MKNRRKKARFGILAVLGILAMSGAVLGAWKVTGKAVNVLTTPSFSNQIVEEYEVPSHVDPGQSVEKIVNVKNDGTADSYIRVKVTKAFGTRDESGEFVRDDALDPEMIEVEYNSAGWILRDDGYWYYTDVLKAGETTAEPLLKSYRLSEKADNSYKNKDGEILVTMESIQTGGDAIWNLWGVKAEELGITQESTEQSETVTEVVLEENRQLSIKADQTDLFVNFKNLLPGCSRTQTVRILNDSGETASLFLRAEAADQEQMSAEELEKVQELLNRYAGIKVVQGGSVLYEGPVGRNLTGSGSSMAKDISLGSFGAGESQDLIVTLSVDPEMDTSYQALVGRVNWIFTASGEEADENPNGNENGDGDENGDGNGSGSSGGSGNGSGSGNENGSGSGSGGGASSGSGTSSAAVGPKTGDDTAVLPFVLLLSLSIPVAAAALIGGRPGKRRKCG